MIPDFSPAKCNLLSSFRAVNDPMAAPSEARRSRRVPSPSLSSGEASSSAVVSTISLAADEDGRQRGLWDMEAVARRLDVEVGHVRRLVAERRIFDTVLPNALVRQQPVAAESARQA